jgi:protoheme IX farnesyltransferase
MATDLLSADPTTAAARIAAGDSALASSIGREGQGSAVAAVASGAELASVAGTTEQVAMRSFSAVASDYVQLTKPRIVVMILVTTLSTAMIGAGGLVPTSQLIWLLLATAAVAASAGSANQVWERVIDGRMTRTSTRPLPGGRLRTMPAAIYTASLGVAGSALLHWMFGPTTALVGVMTWLLYVLVYTPMKTRSAWNTTVGAIAGALPVLIGYTATGGSLAESSGWLLVGVLVAWQYPHFMAIAWMYRRQYSEAGFCMTTTVDPTGRSAGWQSIAGSIALILCGLALCFVPGGWLGGCIAAIAVFASVLPMLLASIRFALQPGDLLARKLLRSSLLVLPAVLAIVTLRLFW